MMDQLPVTIPVTPVAPPATPEQKLEAEKRKRFKWSVWVSVCLAIYIVFEFVFLFYMDSEKLYLYVCLLITIAGNCGVEVFALCNIKMDLYRSIGKIYVVSLSLINSINFVLFLEAVRFGLKTIPSQSDFILSVIGATIAWSSLVGVLFTGIIFGVAMVKITEKIPQGQGLPLCGCCRTSTRSHIILPE